MLTLARAIELFLSQQIETTRRSYLYVMRDFEAYTGPARPLNAITTEHLLEYGAYVRQKPRVKSPATVNKYVKTLRTFFNWLVKLGYIERSPAVGLKRLKAPRRDHSKAMTDSELSRLLNYAQWEPRYNALVRFLADTGARIGGAAGLTVDLLDLDAQRATVTEKGNKTRPVFFGEACRAALEVWLQERNPDAGPYVFTKHGKPIKSDNLGQLFKRICHKAGLKGHTGPHSLRHRLGHKMADSRVAPSVAAQALGHESVQTTLEYYYPQDWLRVELTVKSLAGDDASIDNVTALKTAQ